MKPINTLGNHLIAAIESGADLLSIRAILFDYANRGVESEEIGGLLSEFLRDVRENDLPDELEDKILEVLDIVTGFCPPFLKVWND